MPEKLESIFRLVRAEAEAYLAAGHDRETVERWERGRRYRLSRETWDPAWTRIRDMRSRFGSMLFKKHRARLKSVQSRETSTCREICGCSWQELRDHIQGQFKLGMTWENHGKGRENWCVDHVRPICLFDWWTDDGLRQAFHWSNMQPLWYHEHRAKTSEDQKMARTRRMDDLVYRRKLPSGENLPPMEGSDQEIMERLARELGIEK